jgi:hypothetical protein
MIPVEPRRVKLKPKLRWFQYSLRSLFVLTLLASIGMSWVAVRMQRARRQREAVEAIQSLGGGVFYDYQKGSSICRPQGQPRAPAWLRNLLGDHFFVNVVGVGLCGNRVTNKELSRLKPFPNLEFVILTCTRIDDGCVEHLLGFPHLHYLEIRYTGITGTGVKKLQQALPNCKICWTQPTKD